MWGLQQMGAHMPAHAETTAGSTLAHTVPCKTMAHTARLSNCQVKLEIKLLKFPDLYNAGHFKNI